MSTAGTLEPPGVIPRFMADEPLFEIVNGKREELPLMSVLAGRIAILLGSPLHVYAEAHGLGTVVMEVMFILDEDGTQQRRPDIAYVSRERWPLDRPLPESGDWAVVPNLAIEVVSPNDLWEKVVLKKNEYFSFGVEQVWIVTPATNEVEIWDDPIHCRVVRVPEELDGGKLLPGFRIPLATLFQRQPLAAASGTKLNDGTR
jgi:Uma2 family endonuclease